MNHISEIEKFRILTLKKHLEIETEFNLFISKYIFRCCKDSNAKSIDGCNIFQDMILDNLGFNKKREIIFDSILCDKRYRGTFDNVASIKIEVNKHMKLARKIDDKVRKVNHLRNIIAHENFLFDEQEIIASIKKENKELKRGITNMAKLSKNFINIKGETSNVNRWFEEITAFFRDIEFKPNK